MSAEVERGFVHGDPRRPAGRRIEPILARPGFSANSSMPFAQIATRIGGAIAVPHALVAFVYFGV